MPLRNLPKHGSPGSPHPFLTPNPQLSADWSGSILPDPEKEEWVAPPLTSGWAPCLSHSPEAPRAPSKKARMHSDSGSSVPSTSSPFVDTTVKSLRPLFDSSTVDPKVDLRKVDTEVIQMTLMNVFKWTKDLENAKFLNANPIEKSSVLKWYYTVSEAFTSIGLYPKAPSPAPPSPKDADSPLPSQPCPPPPHPHPTAPAAAPVTSAAGVTMSGSAQKKKKPVERSGTSCNTHARATKCYHGRVILTVVWRLVPHYNHRPFPFRPF